MSFRSFFWIYGRCLDISWQKSVSEKPTQEKLDSRDERRRSFGLLKADTPGIFTAKFISRLFSYLSP